MPESPRTTSGPTPNSPAVALATLAEVTGNNDQTGETITVHFNPVSLQLAVSNELKDTTNNERKQYIAKTSAKLTMDLVFDTTDSGEDVTVTTRKIQAFVIPPAPAGQRANAQQPPPLVLFEWGTIRFKGIAENYKETLDFFSANGVPLRAAVNLTLSRQDQVFDEPGSGGSPQNGSAAGNDDIFDAPAGSAADTANSLQAPGAARALGTANGQESLRFGAGASLSVSGGIQLKGPSAFASGGAGVSLGGGAGLAVGGGAGIGVGLGGGVGISGGIGVSAGASATTGIAGMARLSATEGAFSGLAVNASVSNVASARFAPAQLMPKLSSESLAISADSKVAVGGRISASGNAGLRADVGLSGKLTFD